MNAISSSPFLDFPFIDPVYVCRRNCPSSIAEILEEIKSRNLSDFTREHMAERERRPEIS